MAEKMLAMRYHYKNDSLYNQAKEINSINCWSAVSLFQNNLQHPTDLPLKIQIIPYNI